MQAKRTLVWVIVERPSKHPSYSSQEAAHDRSRGNGMTNEEVIDQVVTSSCTSLFVDYALALEQVDPQTLAGKFSMTFCGVIGFTGDQMRGTLVLATSDEALGRTLPSTG